MTTTLYSFTVTGNVKVCGDKHRNKQTGRQTDCVKVKY